MTDATFEAESEHRLPAAYSQGFAHVRVLTITNPDDTGPLFVPISSASTDKAQAPLENAITGRVTPTPEAA
jgi:hypothetical protein